MKKRNVVRIHKFLRFVKVGSHKFFAFIGFFFLFYHLILGQPYVCTMQEEIVQEDDITYYLLEDSLRLCLLKNVECENEIS